jgi:16S rRNA (guanine527-N7)-methyltransferase
LNLKKLLEKENIQVDDLVVTKLEKFTSLLMEWNQIHNLTGAKSIEKIYDNIIDSLYPLTFIQKPSSILDVGTGAGFPGLILAIALCDVDIVLAEPLKKRVSFLKYACIDLGLDNVTVEAKRVEKLEGRSFELISSRAVTNTQLLLELTKNVSNDMTRYLFYKGSRVFEEIDGVHNELDYDIVQKNHRNYLYIKRVK